MFHDYKNRAYGTSGIIENSGGGLGNKRTTHKSAQDVFKPWHTMQTSDVGKSIFKRSVTAASGASPLLRDRRGPPLDVVGSGPSVVKTPFKRLVVRSQSLGS